MKSKKGQVFQQLGSLAVGVATIAIVLVVAFLIMSQGKEQIQTTEGLASLNTTDCPTSIACNATSTLQSAVGTIPPWIPLVIITAIGAILLGLIGMFRRSRM